jgi:transketolase
VVISPCDVIEAEKATIAAAKTDQPTYIRLAREKTPIITTKESPFEIGKAQVLWQPPVGKAQVALIATGALVYRALQVARDLEKEKIGVLVLNVPTVKPLDVQAVVAAAKAAGAVVTIEEHQVHGGLGGAVAEALAHEFPTPIEFIGVHDEFGQSGTPDELLEHYGMGVTHIHEAAKRVMKRAGN